MRDVLFLSDLDHCLFQSKRVDPRGAHPMTIKKDGAAHCFATDAQTALLSLLAPRSIWVAVTARTPEQMARTTGWRPEHNHQLALVNHGATLLYRTDCEGSWEEISVWGEQYIAQALSREKDLLWDVQLLRDRLAMLVTPAGSQLDLSINPLVGKTPLYFSLQIKKAPGLDADTVMRTLRESQEFRSVISGMRLNYVHHHNDNTLGFWPSYVGKRKAVDRLLAAFKSGLNDHRFMRACSEVGKISLTLTAGDSHSDVPFMSLGDFMLTPTGSPIARGALNTSTLELNPYC